MNQLLDDREAETQTQAGLGTQTAPTPAGVLDTQGEAARGQAAELAGGDITQIANIVLTSVLRIGSQGEQVGWLQRGLNALGENLTPDGQFGPLTQGAVHRFQDTAELERDGAVGPLTWGKLVEGVGGGPGTDHNPHQMDPRLERNDKTFKGAMTGAEITIDPDAAGRDTSGLPWMRNGEWDHAHILSLWSQIDTDTSTTTDEVRCAANAALAPRIIQGAESVINYAVELLRKSEEIAQKPTVPDEYRDRLASLRMPLSFAIASLRSSHFFHKVIEPHGPIGPDPLLGFHDPFPAHFADPANYADLNIIADATKRLASVNEAGLSNAQEAAGMQAINADDFAAIGVQINSRAEMDGFLDKLMPGQAYSVLVDTGRGNPDKTHTHEATESDHFITVGREPEAKGGLRYLYDPFPRVGSQIIYIDGEDRETRFWPYFEVDPTEAGGQDVFKRTHIISVSTAR